jgi:hypothetical protein
MSSPAALRHLHLLADGVLPLHVPAGGAAAADTALQMATFKRTSVPSARSVASVSKDAATPLGAVWGLDFLPHMPPDIHGFRSGAIFVEKQSRYVKVFLVKEKTTEAVVNVLKVFEAEVRREHPGLGGITIHGDSDPAWTVSGRGDDSLPHALAAWNNSLPIALTFRRSAANTQAQNPAENAQGRIRWCTNANLYRGKVALSPERNDMRRRHRNDYASTSTQNSLCGAVSAAVRADGGEVAQRCWAGLVEPFNKLLHLAQRFEPSRTPPGF